MPGFMWPHQYSLFLTLPWCHLTYQRDISPNAQCSTWGVHISVKNSPFRIHYLFTSSECFQYQDVHPSWVLSGGRVPTFIDVWGLLNFGLLKTLQSSLWGGQLDHSLNMLMVLTQKLFILILPTKRGDAKMLKRYGTRIEGSNFTVHPLRPSFVYWRQGWPHPRRGTWVLIPPPSSIQNTWMLRWAEIGEKREG